MRHLNLPLFGLAAALLATSCSKNTDLSDPQRWEEHPLNTELTSDRTPSMNSVQHLRVVAEGPEGPLAHLPLYITDGGLIIKTGMTDASGVWETDYVVAAGMDLWVRTSAPGVRLAEQILFEDAFVSFETMERRYVMNEPPVFKTGQTVMAPAGNGNWFDDRAYAPVAARQNQILPQLEPADTWTNDFVLDLASGYSEQYPLAHYDADRLNSPGYITVDSPTSVYMTFIDETGPERHSIGYFTWTGAAPTTPGDIDSIFVGFINASRLNEGGGLYPGDKILLGQFPAGTHIGFAYAVDGFNPNNGLVTNGSEVRYSLPALNNGTAYAASSHHTTDDRFVFGFESADLSTDTLAHEDFNDLMFYVSATSANDLSTTDFVDLESISGDDDNDGWPNYADAFPQDPALAYAQVSTGRMLFEDTKMGGDYDMNDLVVDYIVRGHYGSDDVLKQGRYYFALILDGAAQTLFVSMFNNNLNTNNITNVYGDFGLTWIYPFSDSIYSPIGYNYSSAFSNWNQYRALYIQQGGTLAVETRTHGSTWMPGAGYWFDNYSAIVDSIWRPNDISEVPYLYRIGFDITDPNVTFQSLDDFSGKLDAPGTSEITMVIDSTVRAPRLNAIKISNHVEWTDEKQSFTTKYPHFMDWFNSGGTEHTDWWE